MQRTHSVSSTLIKFNCVLHSMTNLFGLLSAVNIVQLSLFSFFILLYRTVCSKRTSLTQPFMCTGLVLLDSVAATPAANAGTSLSMARNVQLPCP